VTITRRHGDVLIGAGNQLLRHHMEIRGLGIIDVQAIFGIRSIRLQKRVEVEVRPRRVVGRRGLRARRAGRAKTSYLGVEIPFVRCRSRRARTSR
jgi:HPr kinase/phosphorylase